MQGPLGIVRFSPEVQHAIRLLNISPPDPDNLEAYELSLHSIAKSVKRLKFIHLSKANLPLCTAKPLRRRVRWSL